MAKRKPLSRRVWDYIRGPENRNLRRRTQRSFLKMFPNGHKESLRGFVEWCATLSARRKFRKVKNYQFLINIHYRAFEFIARYGIDYEPRVWPRPPGVEPKRGKCSLNSFLLMVGQNAAFAEEGNAKRFTYVEGVVMGEFAAPMLHAWNATTTKPTRAIDWTHYGSCQWSRYIGVPFSQEEFKLILDEATKHIPDRRIMIFHREVFPYIEPLLHRMMKKRARSQQSKAARH